MDKYPNMKKEKLPVKRRKYMIVFGSRSFYNRRKGNAEEKEIRENKVAYRSL